MAWSQTGKQTGVEISFPPVKGEVVRESRPSPCRVGLRGACKCPISLQRYLMKYLVKALFPVREIGAVMALVHVSHQLQDLIRLKDFERQHDFQ